MSFIQAYHDKTLNKYGVLKENKLPLFDNESYDNILLTRDRIYHFKTGEIVKALKFRAFTKKWKAFKDVFVTLSTLLGIFAGSYLIINDNYISKDYHFALSVIFWFSIIISMDIWKSMIIPEKKETKEVKESYPIEQDLILITNNELNFSKYEIKNPIRNINAEILDLLSLTSNTEEIDIFKLISELVKRKEIQEFLLLTEINVNTLTNNFDLNEINFPDYKLSVLRSILAYAIEEELLLERCTVNYISLFIALFRVFPTLHNILLKEGLGLTELRNTYKYYNELNNIPKSHLNNITPKFNVDINNKFLIYNNITDKNNYYLGHPHIISEILSRIKSGVSANFVLLGESGVGKTAITKAISKTFSESSNYLPLLINTAIKFPKTKFINYLKSLNPSTKYLFILEDINYFIENEDLFSTIEEFQKDKKIFFILTSNNIEYINLQTKFVGIETKFNEIVIPVIEEESTKMILINEIANNLKNVKISTRTIELIVEFSGKYSIIRRHPDSAIKLLYEIYNWAGKPNVIDKDIVYKYISIKTGLNIDNLTEMSENITTIKDFENKLNNEVLGQEEAISILLQNFDIKNPKVMLLIGQEGSGRKYLLEKFAFIQNKTLLPINSKKASKIETNQIFYYFEVNKDTEQSIIESVINTAMEQNIHLFILSNIGEEEINEYVLHNEILWEETENFTIIENRQKIGISMFPLISTIIVFKPINPEILEKIAIKFLSDIAHTTAQKNILLTWDSNFPQKLISSLGINDLNINNLNKLFNEKITSKIMILLYKHSNSIKKINLDETWLNI